MRAFSVAPEKKAKILSIIEGILEKEPFVLFAFVHGSFLETSLFRDIDVAVYTQKLEPSSISKLESKLSNAIEQSIPRRIPVEVKVINEAPLPFRFNVIRGKLLVSKDDLLLDEFIVGTARHYLDFQPLRHRYIKEAITS